MGHLLNLLAAPHEGGQLGEVRSIFILDLLDAGSNVLESQLDLLQFVLACLFTTHTAPLVLGMVGSILFTLYKHPINLLWHPSPNQLTVVQTALTSAIYTWSINVKREELTLAWRH